MSIETMLSTLNSRQKAAATLGDQHALVLAGAGTGKTKTIVARAAFLIDQGVPAHRIQILTFTRRAASEIVNRVKSHLGEQASALRASTFHTWCMSLIRMAPSAFGAKGYRSTQEILDVANWLLAQSPLDYGKKLVAARGPGILPQMHTFGDEWSEGRWIAQDIQRRRGDDGDKWRDHMILARTAYSARAMESSLLAAEIPYRFIGGTKLLESAHVRDVLSLLRIVGNPLDEIAVLRYLTLFPGVGDATASQAFDAFLTAPSLEAAIALLKKEPRIPPEAASALANVHQNRNNVAKAIDIAVRALTPVLEKKYRNLDWPKRQHDFGLIAKLAEKHTSILSFIEEYLLDPLHSSMVDRKENDDVVTVITVHSAKGAECKTCYVINAGPGSFPSVKSVGDADQVEEERRVLYVALTRAMDNLLVTRQSLATWAYADGQKSDTAIESYFFNDLPKGMFQEFMHNSAPNVRSPSNFRLESPMRMKGINLD